jgi:transcription antitermination factor NusG
MVVNKMGREWERKKRKKERKKERKKKKNIFPNYVYMNKHYNF